MTSETRKSSPAPDPFVDRLMASPLAGLAWADAVFGSDSKASPADLRAALACARTSRPDYSDREWDAARRARAAAMRCPAGSMAFASSLPGIWEAEAARAPGKGTSDPMLSWAKTLSMLPDYGVDPAIGRMLARAAGQSKPMLAWIAGQGASSLSELMDDALDSRFLAPVDWQLLLAGHLSSTECVAHLDKALFKRSGSRASERADGLSPECAKAMASKALSEPGLAEALLRGLFIEDLADAPHGRPDPLTGVFEALRENLDPFQGAAPPKNVLRGSGPAVSLAMDLACQGRGPAALGCARWAALRGGAGRHPPSRRHDGDDSRGTGRSVMLASGGSRWREGAAQVNTLQQAATALRDAELSRGLSELGWGLPSKAEIAHLAQSAADAVAKLGTPQAPAAPLWGGAGPLDHAREGTVAFWEAMQLERQLARAAKKTAPAAKRSRPGI